MLIEAFASWPNMGQATLAIAGSNLTGVDTEQQTIAFLHKNGAQTETSSHSNRGVISTDGFEQKDPNGRTLGAAFPNAYPGLIGSGGIYMKFGFDAKGHLTRYDMRDVYTSL